MLKKRKKTNQMLRQAKLTERYTLKMASKGIQDSFIIVPIVIRLLVELWVMQFEFVDTFQRLLKEISRSF